MNKIVLAKADMDGLIAGRTIICTNAGPNLAAETIEVSTVEAEETRAVVEKRSKQIRQCEMSVLRASRFLENPGMSEKEKLGLMWELAFVQLQSLEDYRPWRDL